MSDPSIDEIMAEVGFEMAMDKSDEADRLRARIERLEADLAEADALISVHQCRLDGNPRATWPKGSILAKAVARHEARAALAGKEG